MDIEPEKLLADLPNLTFLRQCKIFTEEENLVISAPDDDIYQKVSDSGMTLVEYAQKHGKHLHVRYGDRAVSWPVNQRLLGF